MSPQQEAPNITGKTPRLKSVFSVIA